MKDFFYLFHIQYLGFRYHGWMKQPGLSTIESMLEKTARFVLGDSDFKILGTSRTDAMVSANHSAFELFVKKAMEPDELKKEFNHNLPNDIRIIKVEPVPKAFNIFSSVNFKEYLYLFSFGQKPHPFNAPIICGFQESLNLELMAKGAQLFCGTHNFVQYCTKPRPNAQFVRTIDISEIIAGPEIPAGFSNLGVYAFRVRSKGFMRNQVRLMMGQLLRLGRADIDLAELEMSLTGKEISPLPVIAPASGLILNHVAFFRG